MEGWWWWWRGRHTAWRREGGEKRVGGQQSQRETGEHDVVSGERKSYFENVIRGEAGAHFCGQTSQLRSTPCAICQPGAICSNLYCHMVRLVRAGCAARTRGEELRAPRPREGVEKVSESKQEKV